MAGGRSRDGPVKAENQILPGIDLLLQLGKASSQDHMLSRRRNSVTPILALYPPVQYILLPITSTLCFDRKFLESMMHLVFMDHCCV